MASHAPVNVSTMNRQLDMVCLDSHSTYYGTHTAAASNTLASERDIPVLVLKPRTFIYITTVRWKDFMLCSANWIGSVLITGYRVSLKLRQSTSLNAKY